MLLSVLISNESMSLSPCIVIVALFEVTIVFPETVAPL